MKRILFLLIILLQLTRIAAPLGAVPVAAAARVDFSSALGMVSDSLLAQLHPVKTLIDLSAHAADDTVPAQPKPAMPPVHNTDPVLLIPSLPELVKTASPLAADMGGVLLLFLLLAVAIVARCRSGTVRCRIHHLFARAREGIGELRPFALLLSNVASPLSSTNGVFLLYGRGYDY